MASHASAARHVRVSTLATMAITVATLYFAQEILIPLALAVLLAFLLAVPTRRLEKIGMPRVPAVLAVVAVAFAIILSLGWIVGSQAVKLAQDLPDYQGQIATKVHGFFGAGAGIGSNIERLGTELERAAQDPATHPAGAAAGAASGGRANAVVAARPSAQPLPVVLPANGVTAPAVQEMSRPIQGLAREVVGAPPEATSAAAGTTPAHPLYAIALPAPVSPIRTLGTYLGLVLGPLGTAGLVVVFVIFMLLQREDLRDRIIRLVSRGRYTVTNKAVNEAATRISRYLLAQSMVNGSYGVVVGLSLWIIGLTLGHGTGFPSFVLWGFLAAVLRFIPYIGALIAGSFPVVISLAVFPGFGVFLATLGTLIGVELIVNNIVEPLLYGASTGISTVALLVSAVFWTWLWGVVGLLLATPLTVCLVVLGKYVPQLKFLDVLLGDQPALPPSVAYYQRQLAGDRREAAELALDVANQRGREKVFDDVLMPALLRMRRDRQAGDLSAEDEESILAAARHDVTTLAPPPMPTAAGDDPAATVLACPAHHRVEEAALAMLAALLQPQGVASEQTSTRMLPAEVEARIEQSQPAVVVVAVAPPGGLVQARYLCRRLRRRFASLKIVVIYFGKPRDFDRLLVRLRSAGASYVTTSLLQARSQVMALLATPAGTASPTAASPTAASPAASANSDISAETTRTGGAVAGAAL